uniref:Amino acid transporter n=1 Tax=Phallusia mammillata TaxID=59560 RepID=A0A6F9DSI2_9ASCI|nr:excitatory amino acid transporter-like [Phallusia mammillata]
MAPRDPEQPVTENLLAISNGETCSESTREVKHHTGHDEKISCGPVKVKSETLLILLTIAGVVLGLILGFSIRTSDPSPEVIMIVMFPGELLMRMLKMLIIPVIITSIVTGLANLETGKSGKIGGHAVAYYLATTTLAVVLGITLVSIIQPGRGGFNKDDVQAENEDRVISTMDTFLDLIRNIFPSNIIAACFQLDRTKLTPIFKKIDENAVVNLTGNVTYNVPVGYKRELEKVGSTNVLGLISFCVLFGVVIARIGEEAKIVKDFFNSLNHIFMRMIMFIIWYSPIGICSLTAGNLLKMKSFQILVETLGLYVVTVISGLVIHCVVVLPLIYWLMTRKNPFRFFMGIAQAFLTALGTGSSAGTLPVTIRCLERNLNIDERITRFVLPLGATMNMDGTALLEGVAAITVAQMYGYTLSFGQILTISITATMASIGAAAIPSAGLVTLLLVLTAIGVPTEAVGLLWSIDWFLDRIRTAVNVFGDCIGAGIVQHLNQDILKQIKAEEKRESLKSQSSDDSGHLKAPQEAPLTDSGLSMDDNKRDSIV